MEKVINYTSNDRGLTLICSSTEKSVSGVGEGDRETCRDLQNASYFQFCL